MEVGANVWAMDQESEEAWVLAEVISKSDTELKLCRVDDPASEFVRPRLKSKSDEPEEIKYEGVELANATLSDEEKAEGRDDDLITLPHLHEPALLHAVNERFMLGKIYTWTGPVLIAVNPFQRLPLYTTEILEKYRRDGLLRSQNLGDSKSTLGPHIYSIADRSFRQMMAEGRKSQSILISGESGAGKTESTKIVMLYLTTLGSSNSPSEGVSAGDLSIMEKVLQSNPVLEAFGNAKTLRNDNSSRFGKFIQLGFSRAGILMGAKVQTYLLEKVRLGFHASGERNYHIFYQLVRGASEEQKKKFSFHDGNTQGLELANYFHYTGQGGAPQLREFTDESGLKYTVKAMKSLGWSEEKIDKVLSLTAGLLHLGQITFNGVEAEGGVETAVIAEEKILKDTARLLGVHEDMLKTALTERLMITRGDEIRIQIPPKKALDARDALSKTIYGALFLWVVSEVNLCIGWENDSDIRSSCGVLDIFGFECFAINSFEQLCINFTNEALQQQFNKFIFKMEQAEYEKEEIQWAFISFPDNQDCLDTIQSRPSGILAMLDDECRVPKGSDRNWAQRLYKQFLPNKGQTESENTRFIATASHKGRNIFCVRHFAGVVPYTAETGFLEKNKDEIPLTAKNLFEGAPNQLVKDIYAIQLKETEERAPEKKPAAAGGKKGGKAAKQKTVGMQFKEQLANLMEMVESTEPHYIRCLKPNDAAKPLMLTRKRLTEQLRYGGVLEAVRVARMGYPVRLDHDAFYQRYRMLLPATSDDDLPWSMEGMEPQNLCIKLVDFLLKEGAEQQSRGKVSPEEEGIGRAEKIRRMQRQPDPIMFPRTDVQLGNSKVFMRKPAHDALESHRVFHQNAAATIAQCWIRGMQQRMRYLIMGDAALTVQRFYRGSVGRARWWRLREAVAGDLLTKVFRMLIHRRKYDRARRGTIRFQGLYRGYATRRVLATIKIQTFARMKKRSWMYRKLRSAVIALQCAHRQRVAIKFLTSLKSEQKDIGKLKENNEKLKLEMASLKAMLQAQAQGEASKAENQKVLLEKEEEIAKLEKRVNELESELERARETVKSLQEELKAQQEKTAMEIEDLKVKNEKHLEQVKQQQHQMSQMVSKSSVISQVESSKQTPPQSPIQTHTVVNTVVEYAVSPEMIAEHQAAVVKLEEELDEERKLRRQADGEIIKLRAAINGVTLEDADVQALLAPKLEQAPPMDENQADLYVVSEGDEEGEENQAREAQAAPLREAQAAPLREAQAAPLSNGASGSAVQDNSLVRDIAPEVTGKEEEKEREIRAASTTPAPTPAPVPAPTAAPTIVTIPPPKTEEPKKPVPKPTKVELATPKATPASKDARQDRGRPFLQRSPSEYFPMIRRGFTGQSEEEESVQQEVAVGWKVEVTNRKEREMALKEEVRRFEVKMRKFYSTLEEGIEVTMWQLNLNSELGPGGGKFEFSMKATPVHLKLQRKGELLVQAALMFSMRGGYFSKALGRNRVDKSALEPLSLHEILEVKAGCIGYDHTELPAASAKTKNKSKGENKHSSLFLTLKASPTPLASSRSYYLRFKSRAARNDLMNGLRGLLADLQIHEGVSISSIHVPEKSSGGRQGRRMPGSKPAMNGGLEDDHIVSMPGPEDTLVPLSEVHKAINKERESYDRLLLLLLQGNVDLKEKEDELLILRGKLDGVTAESAEKDRVQANDSKLIMQLSKKLETLLMDNEDLRDQNDRLNTRLVAVECEKMNLMGS